MTMNVQNLPRDQYGRGFCLSGATVQSNVSNISWVSAYTDGRPYTQYLSTNWTASPTPLVCVQFSPTGW